MKKNEEYIVEIVDNGFQGEGIAKIDGMAVFVPGTIKGEKVKIKILFLAYVHFLLYLCTPIINWGSIGISKKDKIWKQSTTYRV